MIFINRWGDCIECPENNPIIVGDCSEAIWTTKQGEKLKVGDMTKAHIINCLRLVSSLNNDYWVAIFKAELIKRETTG